MGIDANGAQLLIRAHRSGVSFESVATLGRQAINVGQPTLLSLLRASGYEISQETARTLLDPTNLYCENFLRVLGAKSIVAVDVSDYEGAQVIHDMNLPIPESLASSFDVVLDGGTLEHVFNFPTGLANAARMVRPNGHLLMITMTNNFCGHGFYQFSPELFYRFLCPRNGYEMESCIMWEDVVSSRFYRVPDPDLVGSRINLRSEMGAYLMVQAKRLADMPRDFIPQQSDYVKMWQRPDAMKKTASRSPGLAKLRSSLRRNRTLRSGVVSLKKLAGLEHKFSVADYYGSLLSATAHEGVVTPLEDMRVIC